MPNPPIPEPFQSRKQQILSHLSIPDTEYTDLSPKGSVDEGIRDLIRDINALPGLVTTSSCAGRISVFLEGRKKTQKQHERQFAQSGGKGAGRWLYVSHESLRDDDGGGNLHALFGMQMGDGGLQGAKAPRLVRFSFEPMILHIMAASLNHANPVLAAASSSGFRESGLQSLRCLESGDDGPSPIIAVRTSGLALESIIGYCDDDDETDEPVIRSLVSEEYLQMLVALSNERFQVNSERRERFRTLMMELCSDRGGKGGGKEKNGNWEDAETRRERKRAEGLRKREEKARMNDQRHVDVHDPGDISDSDELGNFF